MIYLIFNAGYAAASGDHLVRRDLCTEAIRLGRLLTEMLPDEPETLGLLALMLLHDSRRDTRVAEGQLVTLEEQDRSRWDQAEIREGLWLAEQALRRKPLGPYQLQAAIAAVHAEAKTAPETDWHQIARLYEKLLEFNGSAVIALNHAAAVAMSGSLEEGLTLMDALDLDRYYLFHAARADILRRMNRPAEALKVYRRALALATNRVEQEFLERRLSAIRY